jgi:prepilin-type N-terminal cleavage/methylation domain-containing protein
MRPAFTLIELLVAIAVLTIGVLALAATAGMVASHVGDGGQLTSAAHAARSILDSLGGEDCAALTNGSTTRGRAAVQWTVTRDSAAARIQLTTGTDVRRGTRRDDYRALVPCVRE